MAGFKQLSGLVVPLMRQTWTRMRLFQTIFTSHYAP